MRKLGDLTTSEELIKEIYLDLRDRLTKWGDITKQTIQARMGYVGQHLVSIVTGFPGSRSGARGKDLIISTNEYAEIKTCYRVDQLGKCNKCSHTVASNEINCPNCHADDITRNEDSKWLISIRNIDEFKKILEPKYYYLVLFEFEDILNKQNNNIKSSIWQVDPKNYGFGFCMIDYYLNIRSKSKSKAPFNMWPYQLKFDIMKPILIYRSIIKEDNTIETLIFPTLKNLEEHKINKLFSYCRSSNLTKEKVEELSKAFNIQIDKSKNKKAILETIENFRNDNKITNDKLADELAKILYLPEIITKLDLIPEELKKIYKKELNQIIQSSK